jgi:gamma-glutamylcyclotransferase (GGCT)/AIG2-like uncharacterized protein YtfP
MQFGRWFFLKHLSVFVYCTLRLGQSNHGVIAPHVVRPLGGGSIAGRMYHWGGFPAVSLDKPGVVYGEWYEIKASGLATLDCLEGYPTLYQRSEVVDLSGKFRGLVYHMSDAKARQHGYGVIPSGDWLLRGDGVIRKAAVVAD